MPARAGSFAISLVLHAGAFLILMSMSPVRLPERAPSEYKMAIEGKEQKLFWYRFKEELPKVTPAAAKPARRPPKITTVAKQQIVAAPPKAPPRRQIVWTPAPEVAPPPVEDLPNLLALSVKLPAKTFVAPAVTQPKPQEVELPPEAPQASPNRRFVPPLMTVPKKLAEPELPSDAPQATANLKQTFMAPVVPPAPVREVETAGPPPSVAIVGVNPVDLPAATLPAAPTPAQFAAAPELRLRGVEAAPNTKSGLTVPDLSVGNNKDTRIDLLAEAFAAPTSGRTSRQAMRLARGAAPVSGEQPLPVTPRAAAMKVSGAPDPRFNGRDTYVMAIQMPNLTSYSGSWLMWYADKTAHSTGLAPIAAPTPHRKVDPKYIATAAAERIEGKVQLYCVIDREGNVSNVEIVRGLDDRLNASAVEALGKWEFYPATREGEPVDVDVLVEIPFRLAPRQTPF
ncbi:MAG TPA: TonB family protein [Bryobacteraceae bacterium]|nr:TonB family protein [Bryobacteraceae bacterium]